MNLNIIAMMNSPIDKNIRSKINVRIVIYEYFP